MGIVYRFTENIPTGISRQGYATLLLSGMAENVWSAAIRFHMAAKGLSGADLYREKHIRQNTLSDALNKANCEIKTLKAIADALEVPLWALFVDEKQYGIFTAHIEEAAAKEEAVKQQASQETQIAAMLQAMVPQLTTLISEQLKQPVAPPKPERIARPKPDTKRTA